MKISCQVSLTAYFAFIVLPQIGNELKKASSKMLDADKNTREDKKSSLNPYAIITKKSMKQYKKLVPLEI